MTGHSPFDRSDDDPGIPTLTVLTDERVHDRTHPAATAPDARAPADQTSAVTGYGAAAPSAPHAEPVLRAALQAAVEDAVDEALDEAVAHLRARLQARLPEIVAQVLRQTRSG